MGYRSTSHLINEIRDRFGVTPRAFSDALAGGELPPVARGELARVAAALAIQRSECRFGRNVPAAMSGGGDDSSK